MDAELKKKVLLYGLGALLVLALSAAGLLLNRVKTFESSTHQAIAERDEARHASLTATAKVEQLERSLASKASEFKERLAARDKDGRIQLDGKGRPVFDVRSGKQSETSETMRQFTSLQTKVESLSTSLSAKSAQYDELLKKTSRPGLSPWEVSLDYEPPLIAFGDYLNADWMGGAAYHLPVLGLDLGVRLGVGTSVAGVTQDALTAFKGRVGLSFRP